MCFPKKEYVLHPSGNLVLSNIDEYKAFVLPRINRLKSANADRLRLNSEIESLFLEFKDVYDYDIHNAVYPEPGGAFKDEEEKQEWIERNLLYHSFNDHIGLILLNYHEWLVENGLPDVILGRFITDYPSLYENTIKEYICVLKKWKPVYPFDLEVDGSDERRAVALSIQREMTFGTDKPYLGSFALPMLIERFLISFMQQDLVDVKIKELFRTIDMGKTTLDIDELCFMKLVQKKSIMDGNRLDCMSRCYDILKTHGLVKDSNEADIIKGTHGKMELTLGSIFHNDYVKNHIKSAYYDMLERLFSKDNLNLRNNVMHGVSLTFDPYAPCFVSVMLQLFWSILDRSIFKAA